MSKDGPGGAPLRLCFVVEEELAGQRVDLVLAQLAGVPRSQVRHWIEAGLVRLAGAVVSRASRKVCEGDTLEASPPQPIPTSVRPEPIALEVVYEDADLIVVDKPAGLVVHPAPGHSGGTLVNALLHHCGDLAGVGGVLRPGIVHRLDRGTSGILVAAKHDAAHRSLAAQFHDHSIERVYLTFVRGVPREEGGRIDQPIGRHPRDRKRMSTHSRSGRPAATRWSVLERFPRSELCQLEVRPETGRTHQIRVHLAAAGLPVYGDTVYGRSRGALRGLPRLERPALHAARLGFDHPRSGERMSFEAPLPLDLLELLEALRARERRA